MRAAVHVLLLVLVLAFVFVHVHVLVLALVLVFVSAQRSCSCSCSSAVLTQRLGRRVTPRPAAPPPACACAHVCEDGAISRPRPHAPKRRSQLRPTRPPFDTRVARPNPLAMTIRRIIVFGATGRTGGGVVAAGLARGVTEAAFVRDPRSAPSSWEGVEVHAGDVRDALALLVPQLGHSPRCLHEKATRTSAPQSSHRQRRKPREKAHSQFSIRSPATRPKSLALLVTRVRSSDSACEAIRVSKSPMRVPCRVSAV